MNQNPKGPTRIVHKITDDIDPAEVLCTTYQMRNFYAQFGDGLITSLDVMNFIQHHKAATMARSGQKVLDVCCGRGLMLPLLRWYRPKIKAWIGVDIHPQNYLEATRRSATKDIRDKRLAPNTIAYSKVDEPYYPFEVHYVEANVADMAEPLIALGYAPVDFVIYTAAIEHMQRDAGAQSLVECYKVMRPGSEMLLTSPNTPDKEDPYDTQYAAHLYEWPRDELLEVCREAGFTLVEEFGLVAKVTGYREKVEAYYPHLLEVYDGLAGFMPSTWLHSTFPILTPLIADEIAFILRK